MTTRPQPSSQPSLERSPTRRTFLEWVGKTAGASALYDTMIGMGLLGVPTAFAASDLNRVPNGKGQHVVILGAGMSGLMSAYELQKRGYSCTILELLDRPGGRNFTARKGSKVVEESAKHGRTVQVCDFDDGMYMNMGPARLPFHHQRCMHYCQELGVPLEIYVMSNMANLYQSSQAFGGLAIPRYRLGNDVNYHIADLLNKAVNQGALDQALTGIDKQAFMAMVAQFGGTTASNTVGSDTPRNLCADPMTVQAMCAPHPTLPLAEMMRSQFWNNRFFQPSEGDWEPTLFQPVGGMDKFVDAFTQHVGKLIRYHARVEKIDQKVDSTGIKSVDIRYVDTRTHLRHTLKADYVLSCIPLGILAKIENNFAADYRAAINAAVPGPLYKLAWQANQRFWEQAPYNIFGGISYTNSRLTQMWYPSNDYFSKKGILPGSYCYDKQATEYGDMSLSERIKSAREDGSKLHPEMKDEKLLPSNKAVSIAWHQAEGQTGGYTQWNHNDQTIEAHYQRLLKPEGVFFAIGDQLSFLPGWQEGAFMSAQNAMQQMGVKVAA